MIGTFRLSASGNPKTNGNARKRGKSRFIQLPSPLRRKYTSTWILLAVTTYTRANLALYPQVHRWNSGPYISVEALSESTQLNTRICDFREAFVYMSGIKCKVHTIAVYATPEILLNDCPSLHPTWMCGHLLSYSTSSSCLATSSLRCNSETIQMRF